MTWLRYASGHYQPDVNIRLEDVVGVTVGRITGSDIYEVVVYYSDGQKMSVGCFETSIGGDPERKSGNELARDRAEEIKTAVDKAKA